MLLHTTWQYEDGKNRVMGSTVDTARAWEARELARQFARSAGVRSAEDLIVSWWLDTWENVMGIGISSNSDSICMNMSRSDHVALDGE